MTSTLTWLAYDEREDEQLRQLVSALRQSEARDPLGFGVVRDAIADVMFPGISTIMTRARYFLFVPRLCRRLERKGLAGQAFRDARRKGEVDLIHALLAASHAGTGDGVVGGRAKDGTKQLPSAIYWGGLGAFGIRKVRRSIANYERDLPTIYRQRAGTELATLTWDPGVPDGPDGSDREPVWLELTADEALYLTERIRIAQPDSLLAALLHNPADAAQHDWAWQPTAPLDAGRTRRVLDHAEPFSHVLHGAQLAYNHELAIRARQAHHLDDDTQIAALAEQMTAELNAWAQQTADRQPELRDWIQDLDGLWADLRLPARTSRTQQFLTDWLVAAVTDPAATAHDPVMRERLARREHQVKGGTARISSPAAQKAWVQNPSAQAVGQLDFRWNTVRPLLVDIAEGLAGAATG